MSNRREVRERVMQGLYAYELSGDEVSHVIDTLLKPHLDDASLKFATKLLLRTIDTADEADEIIQNHVKNWDFARIALIDRIILRLALCELLRFEDIPPKVTINEAIEVAKRYSTNKSGHFINGVLDAALLQLQQEGRLQKSGRGLVGMSSIQGRSAT